MVSFREGVKVTFGVNTRNEAVRHQGFETRVQLARFDVSECVKPGDVLRLVACPQLRKDSATHLAVGAMPTLSATRCRRFGPASGEPGTRVGNGTFVAAW